METVLVKVAEFAARAIPGADGAGLALIESHRPDTVVASAQFVRHVDEVQYRLDEGPCLQACAERRTQISPWLAGESRWPYFGREAARMGVDSALSLPLIAAGVLYGSLNVYGRVRDAFTADAVRVGELFAEPAAVSVANARLLVEAQRLAIGLAAGEENRTTIDHAVGVVMAHTGDGAAEAFGTLSALSRTRRTDILAMARLVLADPATTPITAAAADQP